MIQCADEQKKLAVLFIERKTEVNSILKDFQIFERGL